MVWKGEKPRATSDKSFWENSIYSFSTKYASLSQHMTCNARSHYICQALTCYIFATNILYVLTTHNCKWLFFFLKTVVTYIIGYSLPQTKFHEIIRILYFFTFWSIFHFFFFTYIEILMSNIMEFYCSVLFVNSFITAI